MDKSYRNLIFTDHGLQRLRERGLTQHMIWQVVNHPRRRRAGTQPHTTKYIKTIDDRRVHVVASKPTDAPNKHLIISVWVRGEEDKMPIEWLLITGPFKLLWWFIKWLWRLANKKSK